MISHRERRKKNLYKLKLILLYNKQKKINNYYKIYQSQIKASQNEVTQIKETQLEDETTFQDKPKLDETQIEEETKLE